MNRLLHWKWLLLFGRFSLSGIALFQEVCWCYDDMRGHDLLALLLVVKLFCFDVPQIESPAVCLHSMELYSCICCVQAGRQADMCMELH